MITKYNFVFVFYFVLYHLSLLSLYFVYEENNAILMTKKLINSMDMVRLKKNSKIRISLRKIDNIGTPLLTNRL